MSQFKITAAANDDDHARANRLIQGHFTHLKEERAARWEWREAPGGSLRLLAWWGEELLGHYGVIGYPMLLDGRPVPGGKLEGSFVDLPRALRLFQKEKDPALRGVFRALVDRMVSSVDGQLVFGMPNERASKVQLEIYPSVNIPVTVYRRLAHAGQLHGFARARAANPRIRRMIARMKLERHSRWVEPMLAAGYGLLLLTRRLAPSLARRHTGYRVRAVTSVSIGDDALSALANIKGVTLQRSRELLRWRFEENPSGSATLFVVERDERTVGFVAAIVRERVLSLEDLIVLDGHEDCWGSIVEAIQALRATTSFGEAQLRLQCTQRTHRLRKAIARSSFFEIRETATYSVIYSCPPDSLERLRDPDAWYVTGAWNEGLSSLSPPWPPK